MWHGVTYFLLLLFFVYFLWKNDLLVFTGWNLCGKARKKTHQTAKNGANKTEESDGLVGSKSFVIFVFQRIIYGRPF